MAGCGVVSGAVAARPVRSLTLMMEVVRLDGERLLGFELVVGKVDELEPLKKHTQHKDRLLHGELPADAGALPSTEGLVGVRRDSGPVLGAETVRVELLGVLAPYLLVAVQHRREDRRRGLFLQPVLSTNDGVFIRMSRERRRCGPQPQRLLENLVDVRHLMNLGVSWQHTQVRAQHAVHFVVGPHQHVGVLEQGINRERQQPAGCLVAGDQEGDALGDDVGVVELFARLTVDDGQHSVEQVVDGAHGARRAPCPGRCAPPSAT